MEDVEFPVGTPIYDQLRFEQLQHRYHQSVALSQDTVDTDELEIIITPPPRRRKKTRGGKPIQ